MTPPESQIIQILIERFYESRDEEKRYFLKMALGKLPHMQLLALELEFLGHENGEQP